MGKSLDNLAIPKIFVKERKFFSRWEALEFSNMEKLNDFLDYCLNPENEVWEVKKNYSFFSGVKYFELKRKAHKDSDYRPIFSMDKLYLKVIS